MGTPNIIERVFLEKIHFLNFFFIYCLFYQRYKASGSSSGENLSGAREREAGGNPKIQK